MWKPKRGETVAAGAHVGADLAADDAQGIARRSARAARLAQRLPTSLTLLAGGCVAMRGISRTSRVVRWCAYTSAYRVVGAPERRLAKTTLDGHLAAAARGCAPRPGSPRRGPPRRGPQARLRRPWPSWSACAASVPRAAAVRERRRFPHVRRT